MKRVLAAVLGIDDAWKAKLAIVPGVLLGLLGSVHPLMWLLLLFQTIDWLTGVWAAARCGSVSSDVARAGMTKKAMMWIYVGMGAAMATFSGLDVPVGAIIAGFYCSVEAISIFENGGKLGVPPPAPLLKALAVFQQTTKTTTTETTEKTETTTTVTPKA